MGEARACPRCGYDLTGAIDSWTQTCPLATTCSECGLCFELRLVLNERLRDQARFFEVARRRQALSLLKTTGAALRPWYFWRWVVMEYRANVGRMMVGPVLGALIVEAAAVAVAGILIGIPWIIDIMTGGPKRWYASLAVERSDQLLEFIIPWRSERWDQNTTGSLLFLAILIQASMPGAFILLPATLRRARVRPIHLARIGVWSFVGVPMLVGAIQLVHAGLGLAAWVGAYVVPRTGPFVLTPAEEFLAELEDLVFRQQDRVFLGLLLAWTLVWWGMAVGRYLKLARPWMITGAMGAVAVLASALVCMLHEQLRYAIGLRLSP